jgi:hypothetical protein
VDLLQCVDDEGRLARIQTARRIGADAATSSIADSCGPAARVR